MALTGSFRDRWPDFPGLKARVELLDPTIKAGSVGRGHVYLRNAGSELVEFQTDRPIIAKVLDSSTKERVAGSPGWIAGTGLVIHLAAGEQGSVPFVFGTTTSRDEALPLGEYFIEANVPIYDQRPDGSGSERTYLTMPLAPVLLVGQDT